MLNRDVYLVALLELLLERIFEDDFSICSANSAISRNKGILDKFDNKICDGSLSIRIVGL
jgi:hypothetical protein